jgi:plastocyanin
MTSRRALVGLATLGLTVGGAGSALAAKSAPAPKTAKIVAVDKTSYKLNRYVKSEMYFSKDVTTIRSGGTITVKNKSKQEPHTVSFVRASQIPDTTKKINACSAAFENPKAKGICARLIKAHQPDKTGNPKNLVVDVGKPGVDKAGDSRFIAPGGKITFKVTAKAGTTLHYFCLVHPWMSAIVKVK